MTDPVVREGSTLFFCAEGGAAALVFFFPAPLAASLGVPALEAGAPTVEFIPPWAVVLFLAFFFCDLETTRVHGTYRAACVGCVSVFFPVRGTAPAAPLASLGIAWEVSLSRVTPWFSEGSPSSPRTIGRTLARISRALASDPERGLGGLLTLYAQIFRVLPD